MYRWPILVLCVGAVAMTSCTPNVERAEIEPPPPPPPPPETPVPTPHPALGARERAIQLYPDLAIKDSLFNRTFLELLEQTKQQRPSSLQTIDWPISLAHQTASMLGVQAKPAFPVQAPPPTPPPPVVIYVTPRPSSSLDKGAYDMRRGVAKTPALIYR